MTTIARRPAKTAPVLVCVQLSGGNDFLNTVVPYSEGLYYDFRGTTGLSQDEVIKLDGRLGFHPAMGPLKAMWDEGNVAIINGVGYPEPDRSHFRSMDIWHTAEPARPIDEGWLGKVIREIDPKQQNVLTGVSFGVGLPRAMYLKGTPAVAVSQLEGYGLLSSLTGKKQRRVKRALLRMYAPEEFQEKDVLIEHIEQTGRDVLAAADHLRRVPEGYSSSIEYGQDQLSQSLRGIAQTHLAGLGTRIFYAEIGGFDVHSGETATQRELWTIVSRAISDFFADLRANDAAAEVVMLVFSEFGRRIQDNGNGTDHGSGGGALVIGDRVNGGMYGEYPSLEPERHLNGDLHYTNDFRSLYASLLDQWLGVNPKPVLNDVFEQFDQIVDPLWA